MQNKRCCPCCSAVYARCTATVMSDDGAVQPHVQTFHGEPSAPATTATTGSCNVAAHGDCERSDVLRVMPNDALVVKVSVAHPTADSYVQKAASVVRNMARPPRCAIPPSRRSICAARRAAATPSSRHIGFKTHDRPGAPASKLLKRLRHIGWGTSQRRAARWTRTCSWQTRGR